MAKRRRNAKNMKATKASPCVLAGSPGHECYGPMDADHVRTFGSGGSCDRKNLMPVCRGAHMERGRIGPGGMMDKYPVYKAWLIENGHQDMIDKILYKRGALSQGGS
jgi:hypothetical protein